MSNRHENLVILHDNAAFCDKRWILWVGACAPTRFLVWGDLDDALDQVAEWCAEHAPGLLADEQVCEAYQDALSALYEEHQEEIDSGELDMDAVECRASDEAMIDVTPAGDDHFFLSYEWGISAEDPDRATIAHFKGA